MKLFTIILIFHVAGGSIALLTGSIVMALKKGNKLHSRLGLIFFWGLLTAGLSSLALATMHTNQFLFLVGIFSTYMLLTGRGYLGMRSAAIIKWQHWALAAVMGIFGIAFIGLGIFHVTHGNNMGIVFITFGSIGVVMVVQDIRNYTGRSTVKNFWLTMHIQRMLGSYIASVTAFVVVNNTLLPGVVAWLLPTVVITPLIIKWTAKYRVKVTKVVPQ